MSEKKSLVPVLSSFPLVLGPITRIGLEGRISSRKLQGVSFPPFREGNKLFAYTTSRCHVSHLAVVLPQTSLQEEMMEHHEKLREVPSHVVADEGLLMAWSVKGSTSSVLELGLRAAAECTK